MTGSEIEVLEVKDFYKSILDNIINGVWVTNADDIIYYTNKGMENIAGIPAKQIVGSHVLKDFPENTLKYFRPHYLKVKETLKSVFYDAVPVRTPSGMPSYQSGWLIPRIKEGKYDGIICTVDDVTERKEAEEKLKESEAQLREINVALDQRVEERTRELKESEEKFRTISEQSIMGILISQDDKYKYANQTVADLFGYTVKELLDTPQEDFMNYIHPEDREFVREQATKKQMGMEDVITKYPYRGLTKSGETIWLQNYSRTITFEGKYADLITMIDFTERKKTQEALNESEMKYHHLFETSPSFIGLMNSEGILIEYNDAINNFLSIHTIEDIKGKNFKDVFSLNEKNKIIIPIFEKAIKNLFEGVNQEGFDFRLYRSIGGYLWLHFEGTLIEIKKQKLVQFILQDITARKKAEQKIIESEEQLRLERDNLKNILNSMKNGVYIVNQNYDIEYVNPILVEDFGPFEKKKCFKYMNDREEVCPWCKNQEVFAGKTVRWEWFSFKNQKTYDVVGTPLKNPNGSVSKLKIFHDITERKKSEELILASERKLKESEEKYSNLFQYSNDAIILHDLEGNILDVNQNAIKWLGYTKSELLEMVISHLHPNDDLEISENVIKDIMENKFVNFEIRFERKSGESFPADVSSKIIEIDNKTFIQGEIRDITVRKKAEQKLKESEEKFRSIFEHAALGIALVAPDGSFIKVNQKFCGILKYSQEELLSFSFPEITHPDDVEESIIAKNMLLDGETLKYSSEKRYICKDESIVWVNLTTTLLRDSSQNSKFFIAIIEDISDKKELEEESNKFFNLPLYLLIISGLDGVIRRVNPGWTEILGYEVEELEGENFLELVHPDDRATTIEEMGKLSKGITTFNFENRYQHKNGTYRTLAWAATSGPEKGVIYAIAHDITERKKAEQKLKESEEKYRTLFENSPFAVGLINTKGVVIQGNSNIEKVFGYKKEEIIGQSFNKFPLFSKEHKAIVLKSLSKLMKGEIPETQELQLHKKDGSIIWVSMQPSIVKLKNETLFQVITQDISKIKEAELKLKKSEERYRLLFESSPIGIGIADFEGNVQGINNAMEKITGFSLEEYKKINLSSTYVDPHDRSKMLDVLKSKGRVRNYEVQLKRFDESKYQALLNIELEEIENEKYIIISVQDITELKLAEEKLKDLNKLKSELLRRTSHELKTPLVSIKGFSDLLLELHREQLDDYILNTIEEIKKGCIRLETLISDILKTAELESDVVQINKLEEDISFLIKLCNNELKGLSQLRNLKINLNIPDRLIASFEKEQLHQVISNLLNNAIKYTPPHGNIEIKSEIKDNLLIFSIKDSGIGLTEEERGRIFKQFGKVERFGQGYDVMSEGSGLGLYISKKIIELHGGEIWVESEGRNKGTTFYFSLPIEDNRSKEEQKFEEFK